MLLQGYNGQVPSQYEENCAIHINGVGLLVECCHRSIQAVITIRVRNLHVPLSVEDGGQFNKHAAHLHRQRYAFQTGLAVYFHLAARMIYLTMVRRELETTFRIRFESAMVQTMSSGVVFMAEHIIIQNCATAVSKKFKKNGYLDSYTCQTHVTTNCIKEQALLQVLQGLGR